jgi:trigger factor
MKTELIDLSPTRKEIKIEIEPGEVRQSYDRISDRYAKLANVPGFRRGHAPRGVVRTRFKSEIRTEVLRELVPDAISDAIEKHELSAIGEPAVSFENEDTLEKLGDSPISIKVDLQVLPKIILGTYKGLEATRTVRPITDTDVQQMLDGLRDASASMQPVEDRGAENGDTVTADFVGKFVDLPEEEEDINLTDVDVIFGAEGVQQEFTENLLGTKVDDEKQFSVEYPEDFATKSLAGKKVEYTAKVTAVRVKELPEMDDEWAKTLGEDFESIENLKAKVREDLEERAKFESNERLRRDLVKKLLEAHQFEVPELLVEQQTTARLQELLRDMIGHGVDVRSQELDWEKARNEMTAVASDDVRASIVLDEIAKAENIDVSDEEIEVEIVRIAVASRQPYEQVHATLTKDGGKRSIANRLRNRKALDLLSENARVTEAEWTEKASEAESDSKQDEQSAASQA